MKKLTFVSLFLFMYVSAFAGAWLSSLGQAQKIAQQENKLILVRFTAHWCGPCKKMDRETWNKAEIIGIRNRFVSLKIDIDHDIYTKRRYGIQAIPTVLILDAWGEKIFEVKGYKNYGTMHKALSSFPEEVGNFNSAIISHLSNEKNNLTALSIGEICQEYAMLLENEGKTVFRSLSNQYLNKAKRLSKGNDLILNKISLLKCMNIVIIGQEEKGIQKATEFLEDNPSPLNEVLGYYVVAFAYQKLGLEKEAEEYRGRLEETPGGNIYLKKLKIHSAD